MPLDSFSNPTVGVEVGFSALAGGFITSQHIRVLYEWWREPNG